MGRIEGKLFSPWYAQPPCPPFLCVRIRVAGMPKMFSHRATENTEMFASGMRASVPLCENQSCRDAKDVLTQSNREHRDVLCWYAEPPCPPCLCVRKNTTETLRHRAVLSDLRASV